MKLVSIIYNHPKLKFHRIDLRKNATDAEVELWKKLKSNQLGFKFRRQASIGSYVVDFYCPKKRLAIELDGGQHNDLEVKEYDQYRTEYLESLDITVLRFWNNQVFKEMDNVLMKIVRALGTSP